MPFQHLRHLIHYSASCEFLGIRNTIYYLVFVGFFKINFILKVIACPLTGPSAPLRLLKLQRDGMKFCVQYVFLLFLCSCCNCKSSCKQC